MIRSRLFYLVLLTLAVAGCDSSNPDEPGPNLADGPVLPVATGNTWAYETSDGASFQLAVGAAADVAGEAYYRLVITEGGRVSSDPEYAREVGARGAELLYTAPLANGTLYRESTVFRYPVPEGTYTVESNGVVQPYTVTRERLSVPAGTFEVVTYSGYDQDPTVSTSFAPGVGIVRFFDGQVDRRLTRYSLR